MTVKVKLLEWSTIHPPNRIFCPYTHCTAESAFGEFRLEWMAWKGVESGDGSDDGVVIYGPWQNDEYVGCEYSLEDAKAAAQADYERRVLSALEFVNDPEQ